MSDLVIVAIITAASSLLGSVAAIIVSLISRRNTKIEIEEGRKNTKRDIQEIHILVNSKMNELLKTTKALGRSEGLQEGKDNERNRKDGDC